MFLHAICFLIGWNFVILQDDEYSSYISLLHSKVVNSRKMSLQKSVIEKLFLTVLLCYAFSTLNFARSEINLGDVVGDIPLEETNK